jgi:type II secretory pathway pseudopilin PulG
MQQGSAAAPGAGAAGAAGGDRRRASRGFILVMLLAFITSMGIFLTMAMPNVATEVQRDQEAELIFRGEAISNAIKLYKAKTGGYPLNLEDLTKVRPRIIRKLYADPMTHDGEWDLITAVQPGASGDKTGLPIVGVRSHSQKDSFAVYHGKTLISDWSFSAADNLLGVPGADNPAAAALLGADGPNAKAPKPGEDPSNLGGANKTSAGGASATTPAPASN